MNSLAPTRAELNAILRANLYSFLQRAFPEVEPGKQLALAPYLELLCCHLMDVAFGKTTRFIINMPPRHLKTLVASVIWVAWMLAKDPTKKFAIISHNEILAGEIALKLKRLVETPWYQAFAANVRIRADKDRTRDFELSAGGGVLVTTVGTGITGRGFDVIILDDPQSAQDAMSDVEREGLVDLLDESISSRLNDQARGRIILVQQRFHEADLTGRLIERGGWPRLSLPLFAPEDAVYSAGGFHWHRRGGDVLCPERLSAADIDVLMSTTSSRVFQTQYQQSPSTAHGGIIRPEDLLAVDYLPSTATRFFVSVDTATKALSTSDYTVFLVIASDSTRHYVYDVIRGRFELPQMLGIARGLFKQYRVEKFLIEDSSSGPGLAQLLRNPMDGEPAYIAECFSSGNKDKITRLEECLHFFAMQRVYIVGDAPWVPIFRDELVRFPVARNDDQVDALVQYLLYMGAKKPVNPIVRGAGGSSAPPLPSGPRLGKGDNHLRPRTHVPPPRVYP